MPPYIKNTLLNFFSFFLIAVSLYIFISLVSYDISDSGFFNKNSSSNINLDFIVNKFLSFDSLLKNKIFSKFGKTHKIIFGSKLFDSKDILNKLFII